jgi:RHS repeat-associated protein
VSSVGDPRGLSTTYSYDPLNRLTSVVYNSGNHAGFTKTTTTYSYDAGNRVTQTVDHYAGTTTRTYDNLDELSSESSSAGTVSYCYDQARRRTATTVGAQTLSYGYDNANNLRFISQGAGNQGAQIAYDAAGRRIATFMPYSVWEYYSYDSASNIKWVTEYNNGTNTGLYLNYVYDNDERSTGMSGSLAAVNLPAAMTATYGAGNQILTWNGQNIGYDKNGNMTNDPTTVSPLFLAYDERNHLQNASILQSGGQGMSAVYDDIGRRLSSTNSFNLNDITTETYVHDGQNVAYTVGSGTPVAAPSYAVFQGLGLDDYFSIATNTNTNGNGAQSVLHDSQESTTGTEGPNGQIYGTYRYGPFGGSSVASGSPGAGPFQYTGRELDPTGLYFLRARYYDSTLQRFTSPDPLGLGGGDANLYAYGHNSPINFTDRLGLSGNPNGPTTGQVVQARLARQAAAENPQGTQNSEESVGSSTLDSQIESAFELAGGGFDFAAFLSAAGYVGGVDLASYSGGGIGGTQGVACKGMLCRPSPPPLRT